MTDKQKKLLNDSIDKSENILVKLCCDNVVDFDSKTYKDALIYLSRQVQILSIEMLKLDDIIDYLNREIIKLKEVKNGKNS